MSQKNGSSPRARDRGGSRGGRGKAPSQPRRRGNTVRVSVDVARRIRDGHPWIYEDALQGRTLAAGVGEVDVVDPTGNLVARAVHDPDGPIALRVFSRSPNVRLDQRHVDARVAAAARLRRQFIALGPAACFRALCGDSEGIPAVNVDAYGGFLVVMFYSAVAERYLAPLIRSLSDTWHPRGIYLQRRYRPTPAGKARAGAELIEGVAAPTEVVVAEGRTRFVVDVTAPLGTGLFADMRLGRQAVARLAPGRRVLNCFSYTGAFSVVAALHGAREITSVDSAPRAHGRARRNFGENGLDADDARYSFVTGDTFAMLSRFADRNQRFDLIVIDPPTFSTGPKGRPFTALRDYAALVEAAARTLDEGGLLCAASNAAKLPVGDFERAIARGASLAGRDALIVERVGQPQDYVAGAAFPEGSYLKVAIAACVKR